VFAALYSAPDVGIGDPGSGGRAARPELLDGPVSEPPRVVLGRWRAIAGERPVWFAGDGVVRYREVLAEEFGARLHAVEPLPPLAPVIAALALGEAEAGRATAPHSVRPIYVRRPDAELARRKK
jgi:hypothetical protein